MAEVYDQEVQLENLFKVLSDGFKRLDGMPEGNKKQALLKEMTQHMQEAKMCGALAWPRAVHVWRRECVCAGGAREGLDLVWAPPSDAWAQRASLRPSSLIREFEREARMDGLSPEELAARRKQLVQELNGFIGLKKALASGASSSRDELLGGGGPGGAAAQQSALDRMDVEQLMTRGRRDIKETDAALLRSERIVNDTVAVGAGTAETLQKQGQQLEKVLDDLDEIHFTMKKARQIMQDMARSMATDHCIMALLLLTVLGIVALIVVRVLKNKGVIVSLFVFIWEGGGGG